MPRADPTRSDYSASKHLLRNLDDAAELRRNPLVRDYFGVQPAGATRARQSAGDRAALGRIRYDVRAALARCGEFAAGATHETLARMHAAVLLCDVDDRPAPAVAAELGLSERQLRRERRNAHEAFARALRATGGEPPPRAAVCDVAAVRIAEAVELHELGQGALAQSVFASVARNAPAIGQRIEALCLAAEAEFDALRHDAAAAHLDAARKLAARHAGDVDVGTLRAADEHIDFIAWLLRWQTATCAGLAAQPPLALVPAGHDRARDERRRALLVRASAAYALQRWEVGDGMRGRDVAQRALELLPALHAGRTKERLAVLMADAQLYGWSAPLGADRHRFRAVEELAAARGHVHAMLLARAERITGETVIGPGAVGRVFDDVIRPFGAVQRRTMARTFAGTALTVAQCEADLCDRLASAQLAESVMPARSMCALTTRVERVGIAAAAHRYDEARGIAEALYADAVSAGNGRLRGGAARCLASVAWACRRHGEARRYAAEALSLTERYGCTEALTRTRIVARRIGVA
jgi:hypothetical protein